MSDHSEDNIAEDYYRYSITEDKFENDHNINRRKFPWLIDIFLYPVSLSGMINLGIFIVSILVLDLFCKWSLMGFVVGRSVGLIIVAYFCWYLIKCVRDSSAGGVRAPNVISSQGDDIGGLRTTYGYVILSYLLCFGPMIGYYLYSQKHDVVYWSLVGYAVTFFPMFFLAIITLDGDSCIFNPFFLIWSMIKTLPAYVVVVTSFATILILLHFIPVIKNAVLSFIAGVILVYLILIGAHLLGYFYWRNSERLDW